MRGEHWRAQRPAGLRLLDQLRTRTCPTSSGWRLRRCGNGVFSYLNGQRVKSYLKRTDGEFWQILDFQFLEGGPFTEADVQRPAASSP